MAISEHCIFSLGPSFYFFKTFQPFLLSILMVKIYLFLKLWIVCTRSHLKNNQITMTVRSVHICSLSLLRVYILSKEMPLLRIQKKAYLGENLYRCGFLVVLMNPEIYAF